jgi:DNA-directed RNA polymerase specialized sigma24 family protein
MSPRSVRRYRAERLLRREFDAMRSRVLSGVRARLRSAGVGLDPADLEACYSQAWHGLYTTMLEGDKPEVANPEGWLALVTYRRALDEHRSRLRTHAYPLAFAPGDDRMDDHAQGPRAPERDLAGELDDRARLRQLMEGLRGRLSQRERQAAALCYLQGCSRDEAAARLGVSEARMRKLMDGTPGSPGVAAKVGELLDTIRAGSYCVEQSSLMRGFAFGILDPAGERYALAIAHQRECPACRAHVLSLRGLAAVLPPLPLPLMLGAGAGAAAGAGATTGVGTSAGMGTGAGTGVGTGVGSVAGAGGAAGGAAGGGWLLAGGGVAGKLAVGCLLAVGVGASCVALSIAPLTLHRPAHHPRHAIHSIASHGDYQALSAPPSAALPVPVDASSSTTGAGGASTPASAGTTSGALTPAARASREFGPEQQPARQVAAATQTNSSHTARAASTGSGETASAAGAESSGSSTSSAGGKSFSGHESGGPASAAREFGLG